MILNKTTDELINIKIRYADNFFKRFKGLMGNENLAYWDKRILFYLSKMYGEQAKKGESYDQIKKCIHVSILNFIHFPEDKKCYRVINLCDIHTGEVYTDLFEIHILELKKLSETTQTNDEIIQWMRFFSGTRREWHRGLP